VEIDEDGEWTNIVARKNKSVKLNEINKKPESLETNTFYLLSEEASPRKIAPAKVVAPNRKPQKEPVSVTSNNNDIKVHIPDNSNRENPMLPLGLPGAYFVSSSY
jgi:hypothetical protein